MAEDNEKRHIVNKTYDEIRIGDCASLSRTPVSYTHLTLPTNREV